MTDQSRSAAEADFAAQAERAPQNFAAELWHFLRYHKKWWLIPVIVVLLALGALIAIGGTAAAPFIYTLF